MTTKKRVDFGGIEPNVRDRLNRVEEDQRVLAQGVGGDPLREPIPTRITTTSEKILKGGNGSYICLGRDRPKSRMSGYGGMGHTQCASIDLVAGPQGYQASEFVLGLNRVWTDPDFTNDAARIYISQKTDIDANFGISRGTVGDAKTKSGIGIKADNVRICSREGIKLVTGLDDFNSQGGEVSSVVGVDLIANNDDSDLQPIPKGNNLNESLNRIMHHIDKLNGVVDGLLMAQMTFNAALAHHFHFSPFFALPTTPSPPVMAAGIKTMIDHLFQVKMSLIMSKVNYKMMSFNYFNPAGGKFVLSRWNNVN